MDKLSFKQAYKQLYNPPVTEVQVVEVPALQFLMIDGAGDPNTAPAYKAAVEALYSLSYNLKFRLKKAEVLDWSVGPLEGLWRVAAGAELDMANKSNWEWTMMIPQPEQVTTALLNEAREEVTRKKKLAAVEQVRLEQFNEGLTIQIMHIGPYADEGPTIQKLMKFSEEHGYLKRGDHHEIYLSDPNRAAPQKMRTILREPVGR